MPRRLPWKTSGGDSSVTKSPRIKAESSSAATPQSPSIATSSNPPAVKRARRERVAEPDRIRSPSTSPPPEPPVEQFMIPGLLDDDRFRMVEDEFLNMAHQFTVHLHRAEYDRLKKLAKSQNASTIREIERPTVGPKTLLAKQRHESAKRVLKQRQLNKGAEDEGDTPWKGTSLRGLLESPRKEAKWISSNLPSTTTTRASAGYRSSLSSPPKPRPGPRKRETVFQPSSRKKRSLAVDEETESCDDDDDDLGTPSRSTVTKLPRTTPTSATATARKTWTPTTPRMAVSSPTANSKPVKGFHRLTRDGNSSAVSKLSRDKRRADDDNDDDDPFGISRRRLQRQQSREQARKTEQKGLQKEPQREPQKKRTLDTIPSFL